LNLYLKGDICQSQTPDVIDTLIIGLESFCLVFEERVVVQGRFFVAAAGDDIAKTNPKAGNMTSFVN
jgi:hypothetical protein